MTNPKIYTTLCACYVSSIFAFSLAIQLWERTNFPDWLAYLVGGLTTAVFYYSTLKLFDRI